MGRRSLISISAIERIIASSRAAKRREENRRLIQSQTGEKQLPPELSISYVEFNEQSRMAKIHFQKITRYRTVERYIQQNYERYPIYSAWKTKTSTFSKSIKLTNAALEELNYNSDYDISQFAFEIISELPNTDLYPSWYIRECINEDYRSKIREQADLESNSRKALHDTILHNEESIQSLKSDIEKNEKVKSKYTVKLSKFDKKIEKTQQHKKNIFFSIITLFIYCYFGSNKRLTTLQKKRDAVYGSVDNYCHKISEMQKGVSQLEIANTESKKKHQELSAQVKETIASLREECDLKIKEVPSLPTNFSSNNEEPFIPLKSLAGMSYEKIIGCYIIRNTENGKCYVGQSKDVIKRLKQHFKGTVPNNIIFAEDYYSSNNKENLFEFKILPRETKDELDETEKSLIEEYDSYNSGYNGTSGNS